MKKKYDQDEELTLIKQTLNQIFFVLKSMSHTLSMIARFWEDNLADLSSTRQEFYINIYRIRVKKILSLATQI
jgi:hypothetical protein